MQNSYVKFEHEILPELRRNISTAESTEDVKKFFIRAVQSFISKATNAEVNFEYEDIVLTPDSAPYFRLSDRAASNEAIANLWELSDADTIISRFAEQAAHRYSHLETHPEKTESKIFRQHAPTK